MAATTETFDNMLKTYTPFELHMETLKRHNWMIEWIPKKQDWFGGRMEIPFEAGQASSFEWGALTAEDDIAEDQLLMGELTNNDLKELWSSMIFNSKDLRRHGDMKKSYLKIMPQRMTRFSEFMSQMVSISYLNDGSIDHATADGEADGEITVNYPHRFTRGQKVVLIDDDTAAISGYVTDININTKKLKIQDARSGGADVDLTALTVAANAKITNPGNDNIPQSLKQILLPFENGGVENYFNHEKAIHPTLQAKAINGAGFGKATLLDDLYGAYFEVLDQGKGSMNKVMVLNFNFLQYISAGLENNRRYTTETKKVSYGMKEIEITGPDGMSTFKFVRDCDPKTAYILDKTGMSLCGNSFFKRDKDANGQEFYVKRTRQGRVNIVDTCFEAALVVQAPSHQGIVYDIPNPLV